jgi:hypothetical protein
VPRGKVREGVVSRIVRGDRSDSCPSDAE